MPSLQRRSQRPLHILHLPDEILTQIFTCARGESDLDKPLKLGVAKFEEGRGPQEIKNIRLVCRRFYEASSRLLVTAVSVSMHSSSLARLDEISRHPLVAKGVRTVRVILDVYVSKLANDFDGLFVNCQKRELAYSRRDWETPVWCRSELDDIEATTKCSHLLISWNKISQKIPDSSLADRDRENIRLIRRAHELYRRAYLEQERMRTGGSFVQAVADAMARMPVAKFLIITDQDMSVLPHDVPFVQKMKSPTLLIANMIRPLTWSDVLTGRGGIDLTWAERIAILPIELLSQIPLAIHRAGVKLSDVNYQVTPKENPENPENPSSDLVLRDQDLDNLKAATRQLKSFTFRPRGGWVRYGGSAMRQAKRLVEAFTDSDSIQDLYISMYEFWPDSSAGCLLLTRTWPRLRQVRFEGPLHFEELKMFYAKVQSHVNLRLAWVQLMSGSWADVLDLMRANTRSRQDSSYILEPVGAECFSMPKKQVDRIFGDKRRSPSTRYIRKVSDYNPLRHLDQDSCHDNRGISYSALSLWSN
ncbi:hypothetical protein F5B20DRAFT_565748 [Whalleya microplaca]|nr:hypothetical protein F5B20DRAFT_565748 [Whalleya microplaca]